ncbi:MAG TPA: type ISP restriction/modification enzyme [Ktedonobacteraceae bacterium]|nr:type ISP restriction/modification enzyme [Ktedonobacteraceae bacterium]
MTKNFFLLELRFAGFRVFQQAVAFLGEKERIAGINWLELHPDENYTWITEGLHTEFATFLPIGSREAKAARSVSIGGTEVKTIFKTYSPGMQTGRDRWMYDFDRKSLVVKADNMIETYDAEISRWLRAGSPEDIDEFLLRDDTKIQWSSRLKECLIRKMEAKFEERAIRNALYRPFTGQFVYFDSIMTHRQGAFPIIFPKPTTERENTIIIVGGYGRKHFAVLVSNHISDFNFYGDPAQCFPFYTYSADGTNRRENITDWALAQFQAKYGPEVTKWDIFHYVYAMLHHPQYRERYAENLKRDLPHIPLLHTAEAFQICVGVGRQLIDTHLNYEQAQEYSKLEWFENKDVPFSWRVEKMRLSTDRRVVVVNESLRLGPLPPECFAYRLGNRSAIEWVIDQYQVSKDPRSGIESDPNRVDDEEYIIHLIGKVVTVSVETVRLVNELAQAVKVEDWLDESVVGDSGVVEI